VTSVAATTTSSGGLVAINGPAQVDMTTAP